MEFFINNEAFKDDYPVVVSEKNGKTRISVIDLPEDYLAKVSSNQSKWVEFEFSANAATDTQKNIFINDVELVSEEENKYIFQEEVSASSSNTLYVLVCTQEGCKPGEIYIQSDDRDKITVLRKFNFAGHTFSGEMFLNRMYLLDIHLSAEEDFHMYFSPKSSRFIGKHLVLFRNVFLEPSAKNFSTFISLKNRKNNYIALSEL